MRILTNRSTLTSLIAGAAALSTCAHAELALDGSPRPFAPEIAWAAGSSYASPAFTPDGNTVYFTRAEGPKRAILVSHRVDGKWSAPETAPFSGTWRDIEPAMAPDGSYLVFVSNRPARDGGKPLDGFFGGQVRPGAGGAIWRVDLKPYRAPVRLPDSVNATSATYSPAVAADGSVYFNRPDPYTWKSHLYRAQAHGTAFDAPLPLSISDGSIADFDAAVAPDERWIVFSSGRAPAAPNTAAVFVSYRRGAAWSEPQPLAPLTQGIEARLSPDRRTLYVEAEAPAANGAAADQRIYAVNLRGAE